LKNKELLKIKFTEMKKFRSVCIGTLAFVILFYDQSLGLNVAFFALIMWLILFRQRVKREAVKDFWILSICLFFSAFSFAWFGDAFSFFALFVSLMVLGFQSQFPRINALLYPFLWFFNYAGFVFRFFFFKYWFPKPIPQTNLWKKILALIVIPGFFVVVFTIIYTSGSTIFYSFFQKINFNPILLQIIFLTCLGFFILFNLCYIFIPKLFLKINSHLGTDFTNEKRINLKPTFPSFEINFERKSGEVSLILLNILLVFFIVTYNYEQFFSVVKGSLSEEVHERVATIIFSIVMAIGVIMFYFKSSFNFDQAAGFLKKLSFLWIILNALLIVSAFLKNTEYVSDFGLTYKRIGVYIFLGLSLAGLLVTYFKIKLKKTNSFLLNRMLRVFFFTFIITSWINFSWIVTKYNIAYHKNDDVEYLKGLDFNKQILYDTYKNDPQWKNYFETEIRSIESKRSKSFLSSHLYFRFLNLGY
jgi:hypothetical protein